MTFWWLQCISYAGLMGTPVIKLPGLSGLSGLSATRGFHLIPAACTILGIPLALFITSHHVATFVQLLMEHMHACYCSRVEPARSSSDTSSITSDAEVRLSPVMTLTLGSGPCSAISFDLRDSLTLVELWCGAAMDWPCLGYVGSCSPW